MPYVSPAKEEDRGGGGGGKFPDDRGFHCFPTVPNFSDYLWKLEIES